MSPVAATIELSPRSRGRHGDATAPVALGLGTIVLFVAALGLWSATAPLSSAAVAQGSLRSDGRRQAVQHPDGGVIREIRVRDGDLVRQGQVLVVLSEVEPRAQRDIVAARRDALVAEERRLTAERDRLPEPDFGALAARQGEPAVAQAIANETAIMAARSRQVATRTDILRRRIAQLGEQRSGLEAQIAGLERQKSLLEEEASGARQLLASGYTPKTRVLALERDAARLEAERGQRLAEVARVQEGVGEAELEIARVEREVTTEITDRLRAVQAELVGLEPRIRAAEDALARTEIRAPATGAVVGLTQFTQGGVVAAGARIAEIVPSDDSLVVDARLRVDEISEVSVGQTAEIRLISINRAERPQIAGDVTVVSADRLTDERTGQGYFAVQIRMQTQDVARANVALQPGMAAEVVIPTRSRTAIEYLLGPLLDEISGAFRER